MKELFKGKAKELFEEWYNNQTFNDDLFDEDVLSFYFMPLSMQIGVIEDFANSIRLDIRIEPSLNYSKWFFVIESYNSFLVNINSHLHETKKEAREALIKELNKIINEKTNLEVCN